MEQPADKLVGDEEGWCIICPIELQFRIRCRSSGPTAEPAAPRTSAPETAVPQLELETGGSDEHREVQLCALECDGSDDESEDDSDRSSSFDHLDEKEKEKEKAKAKEMETEAIPILSLSLADPALMMAVTSDSVTPCFDRNLYLCAANLRYEPRRKGNRAALAHPPITAPQQLSFDQLCRQGHRSLFWALLAEARSLSSYRPGDFVAVLRENIRCCEFPFWLGRVEQVVDETLILRWWTYHKPGGKSRISRDASIYRPYRETLARLPITCVLAVLRDPSPRVAGGSELRRLPSDVRETLKRIARVLSMLVGG